MKFNLYFFNSDFSFNNYNQSFPPFYQIILRTFSSEACLKILIHVLDNFLYYVEIFSKYFFTILWIS